MNQKPPHPTDPLALMAGTIEPDRIEAGTIPDPDGSLGRMVDDFVSDVAEANMSGAALLAASGPTIGEVIEAHRKTEKTLIEEIERLTTQRNEFASRLGEAASRSDANHARALRAEGRLGNYRQSTIERGENGSICRICMGAWSHNRPGGELHEMWCPNNDSV